MCRKGFRALFGLVLTVACGPAMGQSADLSQANCAQYLDLPPAERSQLGLWLHGYYAGAAQRSSLDRARLDSGIAALQKACEANRGMPLIGIEARAALTGEANPAAPQAKPPSPAQGTVAPPATPPAAQPGPGRPTPVR